MEARRRTITLPASEKLSNMPLGEVEVLMRELGEKGLEPILREKNIPPELLAVTEETKEKIRPLNYKEYLTLAQALNLPIGLHTPDRFWWQLKRSRDDIVVKVEEPFYPIDMEQYLRDYAGADTVEKKRKVMDKHSIDLILSYEYLDSRALIEAIEDESLMQAVNVGVKMVGLAVGVANQLIRDAAVSS